jgi:FKBP-type peptidyl-prolyl cis-trans isomerase 2
MQVKKGDTVQVHYEGKFEDGVVFDSSLQRSEPLGFEVGAGMMIKGFDDAVLGMRIGEEKSITISPADAYGEVDEENFFVVGKDQFPPEANPQVGDMFSVHQSNGMPLNVVVNQIEGDEVVLDANHPLAGKTLIFKIKLITINGRKSSLILPN